MQNFVIVADATCDLSPELQSQYGIEVIAAHVIYPGKKEAEPFYSWDAATRDAFYEDLKRNPTGYSTSPANLQQFADKFETYASQGIPVLAMTISSGISGAYGFACKAREQLIQTYPDAQIYVLDSLRFGPGFGLMAMYASMMRTEGKTARETFDWLEANKNRFHQAGWLDDLSFVAKKGRITHSKAFFGTLAGIKPIGEFDYNGLTTVIGKAKGAKAAYALLLDYIAATIDNPREQIIVIAQTARYPQAVEYKRLIEERFAPKSVFISDVLPPCGINIGPGLMAAYYVGKPITKGLVSEREIIAKHQGGNQ